VLVVYSLSRLARSTKDALAIAERLERSGAQLVSVTESIDTTSAMGKLFFRLLAILAEFERDVISERTSAAMGHKRARGERISRNIPYGKSLNPDGRTLVNHPAEVATLAEIRQLSRQGLSHLAIARELTHRGVPTKKGGPVWARSSVRRILEGEKHRGQSDQGADSIGPVPAVVDSAAP
jgi:DNA invertase Pin-like site-specific DNA recombinase